MDNKIKLSKDDLKNIIKEALNEILLGREDSFTPYTEKDRERNFQGLRNMRNTSYDAFKQWKNQEIEKGRNPSELSWNTYKKEQGFNFF